MKILFTGGSSFTGYWFIKMLSEAGHQVISTFTLPSIDNYQGTRKERIELNKNLSEQVFECNFGSEKFLSLINSYSVDLLCHHAADVTDYKSADFNVYNALNTNTRNLSGVLKVLKKNNFTGIILTGSVFECQEVSGEEGELYLEAFSPYGLSKALTFNIFKYYCFAHNIRLGKFVIPNPFGPYEEPRFTAYLIKNWFIGKVPEVNTPLYIRDNIHVDLLASAYNQFTNNFAASEEKFLKLNPSGYKESMGEFTQRFSVEMKSRLNLPCDFKLNQQTSFNEPIKRTNFQPADKMVNWNEKLSWDNLAEFYKSGL